MTLESSDGKTRKRGSGKAGSRQDAEKVKLTLYADVETAKRFATHAVQTGQDRSALFVEMVNAHCRRFVVSDRQKPDVKPADGQGPS